MLGIKKQRLSQEFNKIEDITTGCIKPGGKSRIIITTELPNLILTNYCEFDILCAWKKRSINALQRNSKISYGGTLRMTTDDFISRSSFNHQPFEMYSCIIAPESKIKDPVIEVHSLFNAQFLPSDFNLVR